MSRIPGLGASLAALLLASTTVLAADAWTQLDQQFATQYRAGDYAAALVSAQRALVVAEQQPAAGAARVVSSLNALALVLQAQGQYDEAQLLLERALRESEHALPAGHSNIEVLRNNLASLQEARDRQAATAVARQAEALNEAALALHQRGEFLQAAEQYEQALPLVAQCCGAQGAEMARVLASLGDARAELRQYDEAASRYAAALALYEQLPDETLAQAGVLNSLAAVHYRQRQYRQAEPLFRRALQLLEQRQGALHADLLPVLDNLVALFRATGQDQCAEEFRRRAAAIRKTQELHSLRPSSTGSAGLPVPSFPMESSS